MYALAMAGMAKNGMNCKKWQEWQKMAGIAKMEGMAKNGRNGKKWQEWHNGIPAMRAAVRKKWQNGKKWQELQKIAKMA